MKENVLVLGASENSERYSNKAIKLLLQKGYQVYGLSNKSGEVDGVSIHKELADLKTQLLEEQHSIDTITLYLGPKNQGGLLEIIDQLKPGRVIFNPGTENEKMYNELISRNVNYEEACTLVLLNINQF